MAEILRCADRWGREVTLDDSRWHGHILPQHPELLPQLANLQKAVVSPTFVTHDATFRNRENFYLEGFGNLYLKVVVEYVGAAFRGTIVTAHLAARSKPKEAIKWRSTTP